MKKLLCAIAALTALGAQAQTGGKKYDVAANRFQQFYNANQPDSIFNMFSADMKTALPLDKTQATVATLRMQLGNMKSASLLTEDVRSTSFKSVFEKATVKLVLSLDDKDKLSGLWVQPYQAQANDPEPGK